MLRGMAYRAVCVIIDEPEVEVLELGLVVRACGMEAG